MAESSDEAKDIEKLYEYGELLNEAKDKSQHVEDYESIIKAATSNSIKARQLAAQLIPRFFKFFPALSVSAVDAHLDLCEAEELGVRVQAIRGLPLFCKDTPEHLSKIVDILAQLLTAEENVERDAVHKALLSLLRQDVKASLTALFKHIESVDEPITDENLRERTLIFIKDKVFPLKAELLKPQEQMERHITDLIKKSLQDVTGAEFKMFMDFLKSLVIFGEKSPLERVHELIEIIEGQADLDAQFSVSDADHVDRLISCLFMALPFFMRGASNSKFLTYLNKHIFPLFDELPEERKVDLLKNLAECSPYTAPQDARLIFPAVVQLLKKYMPRRKTGEEMNFTYVECLLFTFHHLANKAPNATNSLCGYKIVTGQPSDRLGEDFSEHYKDFTERLSCVEELARATMKKLTKGMAEHNKAIATAKSDEAKASIKNQRQNATTGLRTCNNILAMTQPLHSKSPSFIGDKRINLSWKEAVKNSPPTTVTAARGKRPANASNGSNNYANKKGRGGGGMQNQLVNRAFEGLPRGGRSGSSRFLQGLLDCTSESLSFPRDLNVFFNRFSNTMSQPYTKSQLSEKLRRLRKKFRVISARLAKGLHKSLLSPHDRALYELSEQLWHPDYSSTSPFGGGSNSKIPVKISNLVGVKVSFLPSIPLSNKTVTRDHESNVYSVNNNNADYNYDGGGGGDYEDVKLSEVNVEFEGDCLLEEEELPRMGNDQGSQIGEISAKTVVDVFDQSLKEAKMRMKFTQGGEGKDGSFEKRWQELRVAEMEVLAQRLRLVVEDSV